MDLVLDSFFTALKLIFTGDREVFSIAGRTLLIAGTSTLIATLVFIPVGSLIYFHAFPGKGALIYVIQTLYSVPTVFVGLLVFITLSKDGPLGGLGILFTPQAIVMGHVVLISPIITGLTISALQGSGARDKGNGPIAGRRPDADHLHNRQGGEVRGDYRGAPWLRARRFRDRTGYNCWRQHQRVHQDSDYGHVPGDVYRKL